MVLPVEDDGTVTITLGPLFLALDAVTVIVSPSPSDEDGVFEDGLVVAVDVKGCEADVCEEIDLSGSTLPLLIK